MQLDPKIGNRSWSIWAKLKTLKLFVISDVTSSQKQCNMFIICTPGQLFLPFLNASTTICKPYYQPILIQWNVQSQNSRFWTKEVFYQLSCGISRKVTERLAMNTSKIKWTITNLNKLWTVPVSHLNLKTTVKLATRQSTSERKAHFLLGILMSNNPDYRNLNSKYTIQLYIFNN